MTRTYTLVDAQIMPVDVSLPEFLRNISIQLPDELMIREGDTISLKIELTPERENKLRSIHTDNRYGVLELLDENQKLRNALEEILDVNSEDDWADASRIAKKALEE